MKVKIISCWFKTSYGTYTDGLRRGLEHALSGGVGIVASNCGCGDPQEVNRRFMDAPCEFVQFPNVPYWKMSTPTKQWVLDSARKVVYRERARRYLARTGDADVLHFQQTLNAFGSLAFHYWIEQPSPAARVVTVHELDPYQQAHPELSRSYNLADAVLVHTNDMRRTLIDLGVDGDRIHVVHQGVDVPQALADEPRAGLVYWGGHKMGNNKGLGALFGAMAILEGRMKDRTPTVTVHGHYGTDSPPYGVALAADKGVTHRVRWVNEIGHAEAVREYQHALACVIPFTGSFAGYPATLALANGAPVIATRHAGAPEHVGDAGLFVADDDPVELAAAIERVASDAVERRRLAELGRERARTVLSWDAVARETVGIYEAALRHKGRGEVGGQLRSAAE